MADDEKLITGALQNVFKSAKIPAELYEKKQFELKVDESEVVKVNMTLKRGLVLDIEDDSHFRAYLNIGDIVLTVNDKVASKPDFKLQELFKERGCKSFAFTHIRMKCATDDRPAIEDSERRDGYDYRVFALFHFQRVPMGLIMQSFQGSKVMVMDVAPKTIGAMCMLPGDIILAINGVRQASDAAKTLETMVNEIEQKGFARITVERPMSEVAKATAAFAIQASTTDHRDLPVPADCAAYIKDALKLLKGPDPKSIMKTRSSPAEEAHVGFHERIHAESVIPSDIADELLVKTPNRVPGVTVQPVVLPPPPQPPSAEPSEDKPPSVMGVMAKAPPSIHGPPIPSTPPPAKEPKKSSAKVSKKGSGNSNASKGSRKKGSTEGGKSGKALGGTQEKANSKSKTKKKSGKKGGDKTQTQTGGDTEGTGR